MSYEDISHMKAKPNPVPEFKETYSSWLVVFIV